MASDPKLDRLHSVSLFSGSDKGELKELASAIDVVDVKAGQVLFRQGQIHHEAYVIESGSAEVLVDDEVVAEIPEGEMIGEIAMLLHGPSTATVTAKTDMSLMVLPHQRFTQVLENTPGLGIAIARELAQRLQDTDKHLH